MNEMATSTSANFNFKECLSFLNRSPLECLHQIKNEALYKALKVDDNLVLLDINHQNDQLHCRILKSTSTVNTSIILQYFAELFDSQRDVSPFYELLQGNKTLSNAFKSIRGLRLIGIPDLYEALSWAIIGQQINLPFAYKLKARFVEKWGEHLIYEGRKYFLFPTYKVIADLESDDFKGMQFTHSKVINLINLAQLFQQGTISKQKLMNLHSYDLAKEELVKIKGIGAWSADYALMKSLRYMNAYPKTDVGLHNALKHVFNLDKKPSMEFIEDVFSHFKGWEAYLCFYLWRTLY